LRIPKWLLRPDGEVYLWPVLALALGVRVLPVPFLLPLLERVEELGFAADGARYYLPLAHGLATRGEFSLHPGMPTAMHVPLFPLMLAGLESLGWRWPGPVVCQAVLGALVLVLLFVWVRRLLGGRAAAVAFLLASMLPDLGVYSYLPMSDNLALVLVLAALVLFHSAFTSDRPHWYALTGLLLGLAGLTREFCVTLLLPLGLWAFLRVPTARSASRIGLMGLVIVLTIAPWSARNYLVFGELIPLSDKGGLNVYVATMKGRYAPSDARRMWALEDIRQQEVDRRLRASLRLTRSPNERNRLYLEAAWQNLSQDPLGQLVYLARKATFFWRPNVGLRHQSRLRLWPVLVFSEAMYWFVFTAAACAAFLPGTGGRARELLWLLVGWTCLFHLLTSSAEPRYHFMLLPALLALAAGIDAWSRLGKSGVRLPRSGTAPA
jgi:4-amino-4-deoxy-L-arabinose transferase-like glycosyltransferase